MSGLPAGWACSDVGSVLRIEYGQGLPERRRDTTGAVPVYGSAGRVGCHSSSIVEGPAIVIGRKGHVGATYLETGPCWPIDTTYFSRLPDGLSPAFVAYQLQSMPLENLDSSTAVPSLRREDLEAQTLAIAPRPEQDRIVAAIEEQFSRLDAGVAALERVRQNLKRMRAAVLQAAVTGRLVGQEAADGTGAELLAQVAQQRRGKKPPTDASADLVVPESWAVASLEAVTDAVRLICYGILMPKVKEGGTVPYVEVKDLRANRLNVATLHHTNIALHKEFSRSQLESGDVVLAIRGSYDRALVVPPEVAGANVSRDVARIAPLPGIEPAFLASYLMSPPALQYLRERARGVAVKGVNIADIRSMPIPIPPNEEQKRIMEEMGRIDSIIEELESVLDSERARGNTIRASILAAAFSGKLVPQDLTDEPASVLLEQIAAERASSNGHKPRRGRKPRAVREEVTA